MTLVSVENVSFLLVLAKRRKEKIFSLLFLFFHIVGVSTTKHFEICDLGHMRWRRSGEYEYATQRNFITTVEMEFGEFSCVFLFERKQWELRDFPPTDNDPNDRLIEHSFR